jgi:hypothetical protein
MSVFQNKNRGERWSFDFKMSGVRYTGYCDSPEGTPCNNEREAEAAEARAKARAAEDKAATRVRPNVSLVRTRRARPTLATA